MTVECPAPVRNSASGEASRYVAPFALLLVLLACADWLPAGYAYPIRTIAVAAALLIWSHPVLALRVSRPVASILLGLAVFAVWIGPDLLWPGYRGHWMFRNPLTGGAADPAVPRAAFEAFFRAAGSTLVVPFAEELFWRGWLMRWLISNRFDEVPPGTFATSAFLLTAALFAAEHGPYWEVGFAAGLAYGWWMLKTRNLADCILAHAVTNGALTAYVLAAGRWEFWL